MESQMTEGSPETVLCEVRQSVAHLLLNRPSALNAINAQMLTELVVALDRINGNAEAKTIVIRGAGDRAFSAGVDLKEMQNQGVMADAGKHLRFTAQLRDAFSKIEQARLPVVAVIDGYALAGGLELALACDLILCSDESQIGDQHANRNLMAGGGATQRLPRRIGAQRAKELLFTGRRLSGAEAAQYGIALRSVPRLRLNDEVESLLSMLREKSPTMLQMTKRAAVRGAEMPLDEALDLERLILQEYLSCHPDAHAGLESFNAGRNQI
jgi:enoyl-CoA hydratase/carnithine racemase